MADKITVFGAAAGTAGAVYRRILPYVGKAIGNYVINDANFPGVGQYLPTRMLISVNAGAGSTVTIQVSSDNGTTWFTLVSIAAATAAGQYLMCDTASTIRVTIAGAVSDIRLFVE